MTDHTQLRKLATDALLDHEIRHSFTISHGGWSGASDLIEAQEFIAEANPQAVLELLDENERLKKDAERYRWLTSNAYVGIAPHPKPHEAWCLRLPNPGNCNNIEAAIDAAMLK